jgi:hypothetical protein
MRINKNFFLAWAAFCFLLTACPPPVSNDITDSGDGTERDDGPPGLAGTVWEWSGVKLSFKSDTSVSHGTKTYPYAFNRAARTGNITTLGDFSVSEDFLTMSFADYMGTGPKTFDNSAAAIAGSSWAWGQTFVSFEASGVRVNGVSYPYTFDSASHTGAIEKIGAFTLNEAGDLIDIPHWRRSSFDVRLESVSAVPVWNGSLTGSAWGWQNAFNGWMIIEFMSEENCILTHTESTYHDDTPWEYVYSWNAASSSGSIPAGSGPSQGYGGLGSFTIDANRSYMSFIQWRDYPHGAVFNRIKQ